MFKYLKEKLKNWTQKIPEEEIKNIEETSSKKTKKKDSKKKAQKENTKKTKEKTKTKGKKPIKNKTEKPIKKTKEIEIPKKFEVGKQSVEPDIEKIKDIEKELGKPKETKQPEQNIEKQEKESFFNRFKTKLTQEKFNELFEELEIILLQNNVAYEVVEKIKTSLENELIGKNLSQTNLKESLKKSIENLFTETPDFLKQVKSILSTKKPVVITLIGINGSGKTTTIAKLAQLLKKNKLSVSIAAADTFRAASIEQLQQHADNLQVPLIKKDYGSDPASVGFDAIKHAKNNKIDIVLIDTAGRMNTKDSLMKEMEKICKVNNPDMKIFIGESITGNDATEQAKAFNESINIDGIILSKADVDEKGGTSLSVSYITKKPILFLGTGQSYNDLEVFNKNKIIEKLGL